MNTEDLEGIIKDCPRVVAVFMLNKDFENMNEGDVVYWSWRKTFRSHHADVDIPPKLLKFVGYAPTSMLNGHNWPNLSMMIDSRGE